MVNNCVNIRVASVEDVGLIFGLICELAAYERLSDSVFVTESVLCDWILRGEVEVLIAEVSGKAAGFVLYYFTYSTFRGAKGIYVEDLFIRPEFRRNGIGTMFFCELADAAVLRGCFRIDWMVLNWNAGSIEFYQKLGSHPVDDWTTFRLDGEQLESLASRKNTFSEVQVKRQV
ncbi:MAG: GNAT family N-acetyltransferase [Planctomycetaceae bacterium]|nr:GNAT family N-acetyltransferase [Planctomycetaceae bacterium]